MDDTDRIILRLLNDDGRMSLYLESLGVFGDSPVFGHGIGSIFYYLNSSCTIIDVPRMTVV